MMQAVNNTYNLCVSDSTPEHRIIKAILKANYFLIRCVPSRGQLCVEVFFLKKSYKD